MNRNIIVPCKLETHFTEIPDSMVFKRSNLTPVKNWIAGKCAKFLQRVGWLSPDFHIKEAYTKISFDTDKIVRFVMEQNHTIRAERGIDDLVVVMGASNFQQLTQELVTQPFMFQFPPQQSRLGGMMICIIPWIEGIALVPRSYLPIEEKIVEKMVAMTPEMARTERERLEGERAADAWNNFLGRKIVVHDSDYDED